MNTAVEEDGEMTQSRYPMELGSMEPHIADAIYGREAAISTITAVSSQVQHAPEDDGLGCFRGALWALAFTAVWVAAAILLIIFV